MRVDSSWERLPLYMVLFDEFTEAVVQWQDRPVTDVNCFRWSVYYYWSQVRPAVKN